MITRVQVSGLGVRRGEQLALQGVDLQLREAELLAIVGPNGAGKSTLLQAIAGLLVPASGAVLVDGQPPSELPAQQRARWLAYLAQHSTLAFPLTVAQVIELGRFPHKETAAESRAIAQAIAERFELTGLWSRPYTRLSGGEQQRVQNARALCQLLASAGELRCREKSLLLLDEPIAVLDWSHQLLLMEQLRLLVAEGLSVAIVVHDLNLAARFADRVALLDGGRLRCCDVPALALDSDALSDIYRVPVNVMPHPRLDVPLVYR